MKIYRPSSLVDAEEALRYIDADCNRDDWAQILMALKSAFGEAAFPVADEWSATSQKYNARDCISTWRSVSANGNTTIATLFGRARDGGYKPSKNSSQEPAQVPPRPPIFMPEETPEEAAQRREIAQKYWAESKPGIAHDYATGKGFTDHGLRVHGKWLVVPAYNADKQIQSAQRINGKGKFNLKGCTMSGGYFPIKGDTATLVIVEGWATGKSINAATGHSVAVAFGKSNLKCTAEMMQIKLPDSRLIVAADTDHIDIATQAAAAVGGYIIVPEISKGTDFNDMHLDKGLDAVSAQFKQEPEQPVFEDKAELPSFPLEALGTVLSGAASAIAQMVQAPAHLAGQSVLAATALAVQSKANVMIDNRLHPLSLFCLSIGLSGERKSGNDKHALKAHREWEREQQKYAREESELYRNELDVWKADRNKALKKGDLTNFPSEPLPPPTGGFIVEEPTLEGLQKAFHFGQPSQGLFSDEGGQFFGGHAMNPDNALKTMAGLSRFWDGSPQHRTRAGTGESWTLYDRRLSAHLMVQPVVAGTVLNDTLMQEQGILARFLIAKGDHMFGRRMHQAPRPEDMAAIAKYHEAITRLLNQPDKVDEEGALILESISPTPDAMNLWIQAYNAIENELADGGDFEHIRAAASKSAENIARMAGVIAVFNGQTEIDTTTMSNAIQLGDYYLEQYKLNTVRSHDEVAQDQAGRLLHWIMEKGKSTVDIKTITDGAPMKTMCRGSVDISRSIMQRLVGSGSARVIEFNQNTHPSVWEIIQ